MLGMLRDGCQYVHSEHHSQLSKEDGSGSSQGYIFGIVDSDVVLILSKH